MATIYLRSTDGSDSDDGSTWALAKATLAAALTAAGAGGTVYMSQSHAESTAGSLTLTSPGTAADPVSILCVNDAAAPPTALATTGAVSTTGSMTLTFAGYAYYYGVVFTGSDGANNPTWQLGSVNSALWHRFDSCKIVFGGSGTTNAEFRITGGGTSAAANGTRVEWNNTTFQAANTAHRIRVQNAIFDWTNTPSAIAGATIPTNLFGLTAMAGGRIRLHGVDLSAIGSGKNIVDVQSGSFDFLMQNCKLGSSVTIAPGTHPGQAGNRVRVVNCDSADTNYRDYEKVYQGEIFTETTIVRSGGASDGTTPRSFKMISSANAKFVSPLFLEYIPFWNDTTGSPVTVTVPVLTDNVTLTDAEAWVEVEYLGTSGFPLSLLVSDRAADILATPANQTTDGSSTWTTTGLGTPVKQSLSVAFTPQEKGIVRARVLLAKGSTTMYVDPLILASSGRQYMLGESRYVNEGVSGGGGGNTYSRGRLINAGA